MRIFKTLIALSIFYPIVFQFLLGILSILKKTKISFRKICSISLVLQLVFSIIVFLMNYYDLKRPIKCYNPMLEILVVLLGGFIILTLLIIIQSAIKWFINNAYKNNN